MNNQNQKLQAQITKLKQDKEQMRLFLPELAEAFYKSVNKEEPEKPSFNQKPSSSPDQTSSTWTFDPNLGQLFKGFSQIIKSCSNCSSKVNEQTDDKFKTFFGSTNPNECGLTWMPDIFAKMKGGKHE